MLWKLEYRGHQSGWLLSSLKKIENCHTLIVVPTGKKLSTVRPSPKSGIPLLLRSLVIYQITCLGCDPQNVGQTLRHLATRCKEHSSLKTPVGQHIRECCWNPKLLRSSVKMIDSSCNQSLLGLLQSIVIKQLQPALNFWEEFKQRNLAPRYWLTFPLCQFPFRIHANGFSCCELSS